MKSREDIDYQLAASARERRFTGVTVALLTAALVVVIVLNLVLSNALRSTFPKREYLYTQNAAAVCNFSPLHEASDITEAKIKNFAETTAADLYSFSYASWRSVLNRTLAARFTPEAREAYKEAFFSSSILTSVRRDKLVVATTPQSKRAVEIVSQGVANDVYQWTVMVPLTVIYSDGDRYTPENRDFQIVIQRVPITASNPDGIRIAAFFSSQTLSGGAT